MASCREQSIGQGAVDRDPKSDYPLYGPIYSVARPKGGSEVGARPR